MKSFLESIDLLQIDNYRFIKTLGGGKASTVCLYENCKNEKIIAKMLIAPRFEGELENFYSEVHLYKKLKSHVTVEFIPRILSAHVIKHKDFPVYYYLMEYIEGQTLSDYIRQQPLPWDLEKALKMLYCINYALSHVSVSWVVHRDLHPGNIMLKTGFNLDDYAHSGKNNVIIMDFGCHKDIFKDEYIEPDNKSHLRLFGAVSTWSPEFVIDPSQVNVKHDIWALGILFYQLLTGDFPFQSKSFGELYTKLCNCELDKSKLDPFHRGIRIFISKMIAREPQQRILHVAIQRICHDILEKNLLDCDYNFIKKYFDSNAELERCPTCFSVMVPSGNRCIECGRLADDWFSIF